MKFSTNAFLLLSTTFLGLSKVTDGHGFVTESRGAKCQQGLNGNCGPISNEPQSLEALKGYPNNSDPPNGQIASAGDAPNGLNLFQDMNVQSSTRWHKTSVSAGWRSFTWEMRVRHATTGFEYFITRSSWNPNAPLTRDQFESTPFCRGSASSNTHSCNLPSRSGYHVILAVWTIADTANAFYNVIDVQYGGSSGGSGSGSGTCGGGSRGNGVCADGTCCSQYGWCGTSSAHCSGSGGSSGGTTGTCGGGSRGNGICANGECCSQYGWCGTSSAHCSGGGGSTTGTCGGGSRGNGICANGQCCSQYGWCGTSSAHCGGRRRGLRGFEEDVIMGEQDVDAVGAGATGPDAAVEV